MPSCTFCQAEADLHEVEAPKIRLCTSCRNKLRDHIACICTSCNTLRWLPKSPHNVEWAAALNHVAPTYIMDHAIMQSFPGCKGCNSYLNDYIIQRKFN